MGGRKRYVDLSCEGREGEGSCMGKEEGREERRRGEEE